MTAKEKICKWFDKYMATNPYIDPYSSAGRVNDFNIWIRENKHLTLSEINDLQWKFRFEICDEKGIPREVFVEWCENPQDKDWKDLVKEYANNT